ncbi:MULTISPECIES: hypothetical protein [unclassified Streptomyces]|uniref:hypothetical protein n=1 Tax=unclassified Streptomyces TaxID=2593676 RepID=UPI0019084B72|nr:hypothetical protein [Streptomyces sp. HSG2]
MYRLEEKVEALTEGLGTLDEANQGELNVESGQAVLWALAASLVAAAALTGAMWGAIVMGKNAGG